jgi:hypothetical protein
MFSCILLTSARSSLRLPSAFNRSARKDPLRRFPPETFAEIPGEITRSLTGSNDAQGFFNILSRALYRPGKFFS